jgi:hypothetical protein
MLRGPLEAAKQAVERAAGRAAKVALGRLKGEAEAAARAAAADVLKRHGRDLEALATSYARVAVFVECEIGDPLT